MYPLIGQAFNDVFDEVYVPPWDPRRNIATQPRTDLQGRV